MITFSGALFLLLLYLFPRTIITLCLLGIISVGLMLGTV